VGKDGGGEKRVELDPTRDSAVVAQIKAVLAKIAADVAQYIHGFNTCLAESSHNRRAAKTDKRVDHGVTFIGHALLTTAIHNEGYAAATRALLSTVGLPMRWSVTRGIKVFADNDSKDRLRRQNRKHKARAAALGRMKYKRKAAEELITKASGDGTYKANKGTTTFLNEFELDTVLREVQHDVDTKPRTKALTAEELYNAGRSDLVYFCVPCNKAVKHTNKGHAKGKMHQKHAGSADGLPPRQLDMDGDDGDLADGEGEDEPVPNLTGRKVVFETSGGPPMQGTVMGVSEDCKLTVVMLGGLRQCTDGWLKLDTRALVAGELKARLMEE